MNRILDIAQKDLVQILRDHKTFLFLLIMPIAFTFFFAIAFGGAGQSTTDTRLPVGFLDQDHSALSGELGKLLAGSTVIRLDQNPQRTSTELDKLVADEKLAAAIIIPAGYGESILDGTPLKSRGYRRSLQAGDINRPERGPDRRRAADKRGPHRANRRANVFRPDGF